MRSKVIASILCAALMAGCATPAPAPLQRRLPDVVFAPPAGLSEAEVAAVNAECASIASQARAAPVDTPYRDYYPYSGVGVVIGSVLGELIIANNANSGARAHALLACYSERNFSPVMLTEDENRHWRALRDIEVRQAFAAQIVATNPDRVAEARTLLDGVLAGPKTPFIEDDSSAS